MRTGRTHGQTAVTAGQRYEHTAARTDHHGARTDGRTHGSVWRTYRRPYARISTAHVQTATIVLLVHDRHTSMVFLGFTAYTGYVFKPLTVLSVTVFTGYRLYRYNGLKINLESPGLEEASSAGPVAFYCHLISELLR